MKIRAYVALAILSCGTVCPDNVSLTATIHSFNNYQKALVAAVFGAYFWYKQRKPTEIRCSYQDFLHGKNLRHAIPDIFPGFPEVPYKVSLVGTNGGEVKMICQKKRSGHGLIYLIEKNAKYLGKAAAAAAVAIGLIIVCKTDTNTDDSTPSLWENSFGWLIHFFAKTKPF